MRQHELHPQIFAWINGNKGKNTFASSLAQSYQRYGSLTERQLEAVQRNLIGMNNKIENAQPISTEKLEQAFDTAIKNGLIRITLRVPGFVISSPPLSSLNAGGFYVKDEHKNYLGKILKGKFIPSNACTPEIETAFRKVAENPLEEAIAYGKMTGICSICGRTLTNQESIDRGIGPICAEKMGWSGNAVEVEHLYHELKGIVA